MMVLSRGVSRLRLVSLFICIGLVCGVDDFALLSFGILGEDTYSS